jgi:DNA-binding IclR family transcriptional regulator
MNTKTLPEGVIGSSQAISGKGQPVAGTQSIRRALTLLRLVAKHRDDGVRLAQLVRESGLDRGTAHRLLKCLVEEQFVDRADDNLYYLGPEAVLMGSLMPRPTSLLTRFLPVLRRVARISGDTTFLMMRQGDYIFCLHREEGTSQVRVLTTNIGQRRNLGTGTAGVAVFELMQDSEIEAIYQRHQKEYAEIGLSLENLLAMAHKTRRQGYAEVHEAFDEIGTVGLGIAFRIGHHGMGAISLATLTARLSKERRDALLGVMRNELKELGLRE